MLSLTIVATEILTNYDGTTCRLWRGTTPQGVRCLVFVHRIAVEKTQDPAVFQQALIEQLPPGYYVSLRDIL